MLYVLTVDVQEGYEDRYLERSVFDNLREAVNEHLWVTENRFVPFNDEDEYSDCYCLSSLGVTQHSTLDNVFQTFGEDDCHNRYAHLTCGLTRPA